MKNAEWIKRVPDDDDDDGDINPPGIPPKK